MTLDQALAVLAYLQPPGKRTEQERRAFAAAWGVICQAAEDAVRRS